MLHRGRRGREIQRDGVGPRDRRIVVGDLHSERADAREFPGVGPDRAVAARLERADDLVRRIARRSATSSRPIRPAAPATIKLAIGIHSAPPHDASGCGRVAVSGSRSFGRRRFGCGRSSRGVGRLSVLGLECSSHRLRVPKRSCGTSRTCTFCTAAWASRPLSTAENASGSNPCRRPRGAIFRFAIFFVRHESLLGGRFPDVNRRISRLSNPSTIVFGGDAS